MGDTIRTLADNSLPSIAPGQANELDNHMIMDDGLETNGKGESSGISSFDTNEKSPPFILQTPVKELKPLADHVKYVFLGKENTPPVIISSKLTKSQEDELVKVLQSHKQALGWIISDIKRINPSICTHLILLKTRAEAIRQPQHRLNPVVLDVVKAKVLKLLEMSASGEHKKLRTQELEEMRNEADESAKIYKEKTKAFHDKMISRKQFIVGQKVLLYQSRLWLFPRKLRTRGEGHLEVTKVCTHGSIQIRSPSSSKASVVNEHRLKPYHENFQLEHEERMGPQDPVYSE
ncbi:Unknown protein [Striga hermonthica]|uniref:Reverse transcriptase domain-containing protein n=1 Tax=Striga hermonthica TaxID=68872 RepID=A0A9N7N753_STRHE|nr:Unknown protein [Striga hermonthica]